MPNTTLFWRVAVLLQNRIELGILGRTLSAGEAVVTQCVISQFSSMDSTSLAGWLDCPGPTAYHSS